MQPEISVIVPSFNQPPEFVTECLDSICAQQGPEYEVIFVDGGSKPDTLAAAEPFRDRCAHFISEPDQGQADAINKGLKLARGKLVTWLNTDDFYEPGAFQRMADAFQRNPTAPFYMGTGYRTDVAGKKREPFYPEKFHYDRDALIAGLNFVLQPATFINRETLAQAGGAVNADLHYALDSDLWLRLAAVGDPEWVPFPIACSREYGNTKTATGAWARFMEIQQVAALHSGLPLTPGVLAELMHLLHKLQAEDAVKRQFPKGLDQKVLEFWEFANAGLRKVSGSCDGIPIKRPLVIYLSTRILMPGFSEGMVGYFLGIATGLAREPDLSVHVGLTPHNYREIGKRLPKNIARHNLGGLEMAALGPLERNLVEGIAPDWVLYFGPDPLDLCKQENRNFKTACCIPGLQHLTHPFLFAASERARREAAISEVMESADLVFTLSDAMQAALVEAYGCATDRVKVFHPSVTPEYLEGAATPAVIEHVKKKKFRPPDRYALFPGDFWPHKNHAKLLEALTLLQRRGLTIPLVLVGNPDAADGGLQQQMMVARREKRLWVLGYVTDKELHALVSGAACLLFPSLSEGSGIRVTEALAMGVPVACSDVPSLREFGGAASRYFDPQDVESIAGVVEKLWLAPPGDAAWIQQAREQAHQFSDQDAATALLRAMRATPGRFVVAPRREIVVREPLRVSIVTPSFQQASFLRQCVESVLTQDYPHIEYIVCDGGSTDGSREILESYHDRFHWTSQPDGGQTCGINAGLRQAKGDILAYLNSDDVLLPGAVSRIAREWARRPGVDMFYGRAHYIDPTGAVLSDYPTCEFQVEDLKSHCHICQPAAFWHRRVVDQIGFFDETYHFAMDYEYWQRLAAREGLIVHVDQHLASSRDHPATKTNSQRTQVFKEIFRSQWKNWGEVHPGWWRGYLDHLKREHRTWLATFIPPGKYHRWIVPCLSHLLRPWRAHVLRPEPRKKAVDRLMGRRASGYHADGWTGPDFSLPLHVKNRSHIYLEGVSPQEKNIHISFGLNRSDTVAAKARKKFVYQRELRPGHYLLRIRCPASRRESDGHEIGFRIYATNAFHFP